MRKKTTIFVCLLLVACMLMVSAVVYAGKPYKPPKPPPGGGPDPTGTIYFRYNDGTDIRLWTMNAADGSDKTKLPVAPGVDHYLNDHLKLGNYTTLGLVSRIKHNDHYWIIRYCGINDENGDPELYPDGRPRRELFAVRDDNAYNIQLTFDPTLETHGMGTGAGLRLLVWGVDDSEILFGAMKWEDGILDMDSLGIYSKDVEFDADGLPQLTGDLTFVWETGYRNTPEPGIYTLDLIGFDISPDGNKLVITRLDSWWRLNIVDLVNRAETFLTDGLDPKWSPDGTKIAFLNNRCLRTINPDGTDEQIIVAPSQGGSTFPNDKFCWSPDSNFLAYESLHIAVHGGQSGSGLSGDIYRVGVDGNGNKCLTKDIDGSKGVRAWR